MGFAALHRSYRFTMARAGVGAWCVGWVERSETHHFACPSSRIMSAAFSRDHVDRAGDEEPRNAREHRGIDHAQPLGAMHAQPAVEHAVRLARPDRAGAGGVVAPGIVAHVVGKLLRRSAPSSPGNSSCCDQAALLQFVRSSVRTKRNAVTTALRSSPARIAAFLEIAEIHQRRVAWIGGAQRDLAGAIVGVRLQHRPGEIVVMRRR